MNRERPPLAWAYAGRDPMRPPQSWVFHLIVLPAPDLMRPGEEGRLILAGLAVSVGISRRHLPRTALAVLQVGRGRDRQPPRRRRRGREWPMTCIEHIARGLDPLAWAALGLADSEKLAFRRSRSKEQAIVALQRMREPTVPMVDSGVAFALNVTLSGDYRWSDYVTDKHRAMIDAALAEEPGR